MKNKDLTQVRNEYSPQLLEDGGGGGEWFFKKSFRASLFNENLSDEPNFGGIHLDGQYL
jgi:hypothetical protein